MSNDPFADDYTPENDTTEETSVDTAAPVINTDSNEVSVTLKGGRDFDAPWVVLRAADPASALAMLEEESLKELLKKAAHYGGVFAGLGGGSKPAAGGGNSGGGGRATPGPTTHPTGRQEFCKHGEMEYKTGVSKAGKPYKVFSCSGPRDEQCKGVFDNG